jgi:hypothetical protein
MIRRHPAALRTMLLGLLVVGVTACSDGSSGSSTPQGGGGSADCAGGDFENTYDAIQQVIFEGHGCTQSVCHGSAQQAGLDLRPGNSYRSLFEVKSASSADLRVAPGQPTQSFLYEKLSAATDPGSFQIIGSPMPNGLPPISSNELEAIKIWIEAGAPEHGSVGDSVRGDSKYVGNLLGACLPPATPISIEPLAPPAAGEGVQLAMPTYVLPANKEMEVCFAQYIDLTNQVPAEFQDAARNVFFANGSQLRQDPGSHHLVIAYSGFGADKVHDPAFGSWTCKGGASDGQTCEPTDLGACGADSLCGSEVKPSTACIGFGPAGSLATVAGGGIGGAQTPQQTNPPRDDGFYDEIPMRGIIYWNSHAFNLTNSDHRMHAWQNYSFAKQRTFPIQSLVDSHAIYIQAGQPPFTIKHYCSTHEMSQGSELLSLTSHTHKRGHHFTVTTSDGSMIYESFEYNDPVNKSFEPPLRFDSPDADARTLTYCADYNNGVNDDGTPDVRLVTRLSTMPDRTTCTPVACVAGKVGAACNGAGDGASCDSSPGAGDGVCDACPITAGVTTENEMFVLVGAFALPGN